MEENKDNQTVSEKLTYEQLEQVASHFQQRAVAAEARLTSIEMAEMKIGFMFKVLKFKECFSEEFVTKCVKSLEGILDAPDKEQAPSAQ